MGIVVADLDSPETLGPFNTPQECYERAQRAGFANYDLWEGGQRLERVGQKPKLVRDPTQGETDGI